MTGARARQSDRPDVRAEPGAAFITAPAVPSGRVTERGRSKAFRPLPREARAAAVERGLAAYGRGAWYLAHEELEPAWMGTDDPAERALLSGLIKLAAAYVHAARGNPLGVRTNLRGARERLANATAAGLSGRAAGPAVGPPGPSGAAEWIDLPVLLAGVDDRLTRIDALCAGSSEAATDVAGAAPPSHDVAGPAGRFRGAAVAIPRLPLPRRAP